MTVAELIEQLQELPEYYEVVVTTVDGEHECTVYEAFLLVGDAVGIRTDLRDWFGDEL